MRIVAHSKVVCFQDVKFLVRFPSCQKGRSKNGALKFCLTRILPKEQKWQLTKVARSSSSIITITAQRRNIKGSKIAALISKDEHQSAITATGYTVGINDPSSILISISISTSSNTVCVRLC